MPGNRLRTIAASRRNVYEALKRRGMSKTRAAKIANAGTTRAKRSAMSRKGSKRR